MFLNVGVLAFLVRKYSIRLHFFYCLLLSNVALKCSVEYIIDNHSSIKPHYVVAELFLVDICASTDVDVSYFFRVTRCMCMYAVCIFYIYLPVQIPIKQSSRAFMSIKAVFLSSSLYLLLLLFFFPVCILDLVIYCWI